MKQNLQNQHQEQQQTEQISPELVKKFDGDKQLVEKFMEHGYTTEQLEQSTITHPTDTDPAVVVDGKVIGFWL